MSSPAPQDTGRICGAVAVVGRVPPDPTFPCVLAIRRYRPAASPASPAFQRRRDRRLPASPTRTPRRGTFPPERPAVAPALPSSRATRPDTGPLPGPPANAASTTAAMASGCRCQRRLFRVSQRGADFPFPHRPTSRTPPLPHRHPTPVSAALGRTPPPAPAAVPTPPPASAAPGRPPSRPRPRRSATRGSRFRRRSSACSTLRSMQWIRSTCAAVPALHT